MPRLLDRTAEDIYYGPANALSRLRHMLISSPLQDSLVTLSVGDDDAAVRILDQYLVSVGIPYDTRRRAEYELQPGEKLSAFAMPAFPSSPMIDTFGGTDADPIASGWSGPIRTTNAQMRRVSNALRPNATTFSGSYWAQAQYGAEQEAFLTVTVLGTSDSANSVGVFARLVSPNTSSVSGYIFNLNYAAAGTDTLQLYREDNGSDTAIGSSYSLSFSAGDKIGIRCILSRIEGWYCPAGGSWRRVCVATDATYTDQGFVGILAASDATTVVDDFGGGDIGSAATPKIRDNFNRANSATVGTGWTEGVHGSTTRAEIVSNTLCVTGSGGGSISCFTQDGSFMRGFVKAKVSAIDANSDSYGLSWTKASDTTHGYHCEFSGVGPTLGASIYLDNGTFLSGQTGTDPLLQPGDEIGFYIEDYGDRARLEVWKKAYGSVWKLVAPYTTNTTTEYQGGPYYPGARVKYTTSALDDWGYAIAKGSPFVSVLDTFNRADGAVGSNWTTPGFSFATGFSVASNRVSAPSAQGWQYWNPTNFGPDVAVEARIAVLPSAGKRVYVYARTDVSGSTPEGYALTYNQNGTMTLIKSNGGSETVLHTSTSFTPAVNDVIRLEIRGSVLLGFLNGALANLAKDTTFASPGRCALYIEDTTARVDNFAASDGNVFGYPLIAIDTWLEDL